MKSSAEQAREGSKRRPDPVQYRDTNWRPRNGGLRKPYLPLDILICLSVGQTEVGVVYPWCSEQDVADLREEYGDIAGDWYWSDRLSIPIRLDLIATKILAEDRRDVRAGRGPWISPEFLSALKDQECFGYFLPSQGPTLRRLIPFDPVLLQAMIEIDPETFKRIR